MEKYKIIDIKKDGETVLTLEGLNLQVCKTRSVFIHRGVRFEIGGKFNIITQKHFDGFCTDLAYAYRAENKYYVDFQVEPIIPFGIKDYCEKLGWKNRRELNGAIKRALRSRGDVPSWSLATNLKLILGNNLYNVMSH